MADEATRRVVSEIPVLKTNAGPRDRELWVQRLKEEYQSLIRVSFTPVVDGVAKEWRVIRCSQELAPCGSCFRFLF